MIIKEDLKIQIEKKGWQGNAKDIFQKQIPKIEYLIEYYVPKNGLTFVYGSPGTAKSLWCLYAGLCCVSGKGIFNELKTKKSNVIYLDEENGQVRTATRLKSIQRTLKIKDKDLENFNFYGFKGLDICNANYLIWLGERIKETNTKLIIIDGLSRVFIGDQRNESEVSKIFRCLSPLISEYGCSFIIIHHETKGNYKEFWKTKNMDNMSGSRQLSAMADSLISFEKLKEGKFLIKQTKNRDGENRTEDGFYLDVVEGSGETKMDFRYSPTEKSSTKGDKCKEDIVKLLDKDSKKSFKSGEILKEMKKAKHKKSTINNSLAELKKEHKIVSTIYGNYQIK